MSIDILAGRAATHRSEALFAADLAEQNDELTERLGGSRVLVIGGAGSIGSATVRLLASFRPAALHVVDQSENNLAELVRDLRSSADGLGVSDFRTLPIDFGSPIMRRFLQESDPYPLVLNFAAIKHVRSEKDTYSLLQMLDTNVVKQARVLRWLNEKGTSFRYFGVSTDKAANPVNLMGASKRVMEHVLFAEDLASGSYAQVTSARFANVAFSDGSLLDSFLNRLRKRQPLAVPADTRRYFISLQEAGQICALAAVCAPERHLLIPDLDPSEDLHDLQSVAEAVLCDHGYTPRHYRDEAEARRQCEADMRRGYYPLLVTPLDTSGEKPYEEFVGDDEVSVSVGLKTLSAVPYVPAPPGSVARFLDRVERIVSTSDTRASKQEINGWIHEVVPQFRHIETGKHLDARM